MKYSASFVSLCLLAGLFASSALADETTPIATVRNLDADVRIDIVSLKRTENNTVTMKFALVNDGPGDAGITASNTRLIDLVGRRRYDTGLEMAGPCSAPNGGRKLCWVMFAAPPSATKSVNVQFYGNWPLVSAPISE